MSQLLSILSGQISQGSLSKLDDIFSYVTYTAEGVVDFGDTGDSGGFVFATPSDRRGIVYQIDLYDNGETFAGTTTKARVDVGDGSDADEFATTGDIADGTVGQVFSITDETLTAGDTPIIEAGDQVTVTCVDATGTPTGQAKVAVTMFYFK